MPVGRQAKYEIETNVKLYQVPASAGRPSTKYKVGIRIGTQFC